MDKTRITYLVTAFFKGSCTVEEKEELAVWIGQSGDDEALRSVLEDAWFRYVPGEDIVAMAGPFMDRLRERMFLTEVSAEVATGSEVDDADELSHGLQLSETVNEPAARVIALPWYRRRWKPLAAAAILLLVVTGAVLLQNRSNTGLPTEPGPQTGQSKDARPGGNKAMLTLGDGSRITLDSAGIGALAKQGNAMVEKSSADRIAYHSSESKTAGKAIVYNTLSTPRGGKYQLTLPDGTIVWLNASSSITYPVAFSGDKRKVTVTGESYFEVHSDPAHPFVVSKEDVDITVLGTQFNVNAYEDEEQMRVTLVEGAVKVDKGQVGVVLKPGHQARVTGLGQASPSSLTQLDHVNISAVTAWKNGSFNFAGKTLPEILRQLSRWYDVDVVYQGPVRQVNIAGEMGMDLNLSQVLKVLRKMGVRAQVEGKNLIVLP